MAAEQQRGQKRSREEATTGTIEAVDSKTPNFGKGQRIIDDVHEVTVIEMEDGNRLLVFPEFLSQKELVAYCTVSVGVERKQGASGFNLKPRFEVCYTPDGLPYRYSGKSHFTTHYPQHVLKVADRMVEKMEEAVPSNPFSELSTAVDIRYGKELKQGGSISAHADDEMPWGAVCVLSLGQKRWLRVQSVRTREYTNVALTHNSLIVMYGRTFQQKYTHRVDKLSPKEPVFDRYSLNVRFLEKKKE